MPYVAKVYSVRITSAPDLHQHLSTLSGLQAGVFPRIENLTPVVDNRISGDLQIQYITVSGFRDTTTYNFVFNLESGRLYLMGISDGRDIAIRALNTAIDSHVNTIEQRLLTTANIVQDIFQIMRAQYTRNYIKKMKLTFGSQGFIYGESNNPFYELEYRFVGNVCASTHPDYDRFVENAIKIKANFGVFRLGAMNLTKPMAIAINDDFSFRVWFDCSPRDWVVILDILTNI